MSGSSGGGSSDHRGTPSKGGRSDTNGTVSHTTLQQAGVYSGSYAVPGVFGGQTLTFQHGGGSSPRPPSVSAPTAAPSQPPQAAGSINGTANHMVLDNDPSLHHPPAVTSVAWGGAAIASPAVLFGQQEVRVHVFFFLLQVLLYCKQQSTPQGESSVPVNPLVVQVVHMIDF